MRNNGKQSCPPGEPGWRTNVRNIVHNGLVYQYQDGTQDIICSDRPIFREPGWEAAEPPETAQKRLREAGKTSEGDDMKRSMRRARSKLRRLALSNAFGYFVTLTLSPEQVNRYDGKEITRKLNAWLGNMVQRAGLRYILVPEQHKDGAYHFHGFMAGDGLRLVDSGVRWDGRVVYNLPQWRYGYTTAQALYGDYHAAVAYCCKYIGKQEGGRLLGRWYFSGGGLREPDRIYADLEYETLEGAVEFVIPGGRIKVSNTKGERHEQSEGQRGKAGQADGRVGVPPPAGRGEGHTASCAAVCPGQKADDPGDIPGDW